MELIYILVGFENVQPPDLGLLRALHYRVKLFHGPHQNKLDMAIVKALQPLSDRVEYIQSGRHGKNALDFHVAFYIGRLLEAHESNGNPARFFVVSKDRDFDPLLSHVRSLGFPAQQVVTIRDALGSGPKVSSAVAVSPAVERSEMAVGPAPSIQQSEPATTVVPEVTGTLQQNAPEEKASPKSTATAPNKQAPSKKPAAKIIDQVVEHLRTHPKNRPAKRVTLERHIQCLLGGTTSAATVQGVIAELVRLKKVAFSDKKVSYALKDKK